MIESRTAVSHFTILLMLTLTWLDVDHLVRTLSERLKNHSFEGIVGVARSGLVPAVMLSHILRVREFAVLDIRRTVNDDVNGRKHDPVLRGTLNVESLRASNVLLVDDIVGAGATILAARAELDGPCASVTTASLIVNEGNLGARPVSQVVDHCARVVHDWVVFPWEGKGPVASTPGRVGSQGDPWPTRS